MGRDAVAAVLATVEGLSPADRENFLRQLHNRGILKRGRRGPAKTSHEVIRLRFEEDMKVATIAERTGKSLGAVKAICRRHQRRHQQGC